MEDKVQVPQAPAILPAAEAKKWKETYASALKQAQADHPDDVPSQLKEALREANRILRVPEPKTAADVEKLAPWQVLKKSVGEGGVVRVITCDGKKYEVPPASGGQVPSGKKKGELSEVPTIEEAVAAGYTPEVAEIIVARQTAIKEARESGASEADAKKAGEKAAAEVKTKQAEAKK
jgi:hypothetical protein